MAGSGKETRDLILKSLEARVQKRFAVSTYDRFGGSSPVFLNQLEKGRRLERGLTSEVRKTSLRASLETINRLTIFKREEEKLLSKVDRKKLGSVEQLCRRVEDLRQEVALDLDGVLDAADSALGTKEDGSDLFGPGDPVALVDEWRLEELR